MNPLHTPICDLFGIEYPIFLAGMGGVSTAPLVAAVSNAGGLGVIGAATMDPAELRRQIHETRDRTDKPFAVDLLAPDPNRIRPQVEVMFDEDVKVFVAGLAVPADFIVEMHARGIKVVVMCGRVRHAQKSEQAGADVVAAQGTEAGGHTGEVGTMALVPQVVDAVRIPVLAAGGLADGRGLVASLALGAQGAVFGTRFIASLESQAAQGYREAIVRAHEDDTMRTRCYTGKPARMVRNAWTDAWELANGPGALGMPLQNILTSEANARIRRSNRTDLQFAPVGQIVGRMNEVRSVRDVIYGLVEEYIDTVERLEQGVQI